MKVIRIDFCDFWSGFDKHDNYFVKLLSKEYQVEIVEKPDFLIFSVYGDAHLNYDCTKIYYTSESKPPDFLQADFAISFERKEDNRNIRFPLYNLYGDMRSLSEPKKPFSEISKVHTKFCNMVVTNGNSKKRIEFFHKLSKYKKVDSGGKFLNNIGGPVQDKRTFISEYKFTFAFENRIYPGYTTEKIVEPMFCGSMPIYWGNPFISEEFNTQSFINWDDYGNDESVIERIIELDQNDDLYEQVYNQPFFHNNEPNIFCDEERLMAFFKQIFNQYHPRIWYRLRRRFILDYYKSRIFLGATKNRLISSFR